MGVSPHLLYQAAQKGRAHLLRKFVPLSFLVKGPPTSPAATVPNTTGDLHAAATAAPQMDTSNSGMQERERGEVGLLPSGIHYVPAVAAGIAVAEVLGSVVAAFVIM